MDRGGRRFRIMLCLLCLGAVVASQGMGQGNGKGQDKRNQEMPQEVQARSALSVVLGRPTDTGIVLNIFADRGQVVSLQYWFGDVSSAESIQGIVVPEREGVEVPLNGLLPDTEYFFRLAGSVEGRFRTQRKVGSEFTFEVMGDSHPERPSQFSPALYVKTLGSVAADRPDFFIAMGDDFSVDTLPAITPGAVAEVFGRQRLYLSIIGAVAPVYLVNGNHEQASMANLDGTADNVAVWSQTARNSLFPQPSPDGFYSGDGERVEHIGLLRDYCAWTWGDATFVVLDPYWHSPVVVDNEPGGKNREKGSGKAGRDPWRITLGEAQYRWLESTLETTSSKFVFVFIHHISGTGRGGIEAATLYEWGGRDPQGKNEFAKQRPGWPMPIHDLFVKYGVTAVFQGHDHLFARQELDGITYMTMPEPADPAGTLYNSEAYRSGVELANSGRVRVTVGQDEVLVEYLKQDSTPAYSFSLESRKGERP